jgi:beta-lactamase regulating signal transducer with metallopeptidase domain
MGSILAGMIILIKKLLNNKLSANWHYYIWFLLVIRLTMPYAPESSLSIFNLFPSAPPKVETREYIDNTDKNVAFSPIEAEKDLQVHIGTDTDTAGNMQSKLAETANMIEPKKNRFVLNFKLISIIYLTGTALILLYIFILNFTLLIKTRKHICEDEKILGIFNECKLKMNVKKDIPIIYDRNIKTPSLFGLVKPKLLITSEIINALSEEEKRYVFLHELAHLKRKDNLANWLILLVQILHWFNPIIWYAFRKMREDCEVACDAYVLSRLNEAEHKKYGETIINLISTISKPYWVSITTGLTSKGTGIKRRIKMITMFKKNSWKWSVIAVIIILVIGAIGLTNQTSLQTQAKTSLQTQDNISLQTQARKEEIRHSVSETNIRTGIAKIELILDADGVYWNGVKPISVTDNKMIHDIMSMIEESKPLADESKISNMSGMAIKNNKLIVNGTDGSKREITFAYDTLYEIGYIEEDGRKTEPDYSFFRYVADLNEYTNPDTNIELRVIQLFGRYNWTVDYRINTLKEKLPDNLKHKAGEYPVKIYWAYNNELSKDIGLDFTGYLGKDIVIDIYRLREPLPEFLKPRTDARGIVLKYNDEIIGAYIDAGRHDSFACSLNRKSLKDITGKEWEGWIADYIDYEDQLEIKLSQMGPKDIIREYFKALNKHDIKTVWACMTRKSLSKLLASNMDNSKYLFNKDADKIDYNINSAKLLEIRELKEFNDVPGVLEYQVKVNYDFVKPIISDDGVWTRFVILKKESEKSGWRIDGVGTGP